MRVRVPPPAPATDRPQCQSRIQGHRSMEIVFIFKVIVFLYSVIAHEVAHGWVADLMGDDTARLAGRLTANPIPHIDPMGSIIIPGILLISGSPFLIGWAKPVPVNPLRFKNVRKGMLLTSAAGPLTNFTIVIFLTLLAHSPLVVRESVAWEVLFFGVLINLILGFFNLIPVPPLDGSKVVWALLPRVLADKYLSIERYGMIVLMVLIVTRITWFIVVPPTVIAMKLLGFGPMGW